MALLKNIGDVDGLEPSTDTPSDEPPTNAAGVLISELRADSIATKAAHRIALDKLDAVGIARYITNNVEDDMIDPKRLREIKILARKNPRLMLAFKIAMNVLRDSNEIDENDSPYGKSNVIDGMAM